MTDEDGVDVVLADEFLDALVGGTVCGVEAADTLTVVGDWVRQAKVGCPSPAVHGTQTDSWTV